VNVRLATLIVTVATLLPAIAAPPADASRKLSVTTLAVQPTSSAGEPVAISGAVRNAGDERARMTVRAYLRDTVGQLRLGGRRLKVGAGAEREFSFAPELPDGTPDGDYQVAVCVRRLNKRGPERCASAPLTIQG
jgi:hypothetical protein